MHASLRSLAFLSAVVVLLAVASGIHARSALGGPTTGVTTRVSVASDGTEGNGFSGTPSISGDGRFVAFASSATNLVEGDEEGAADTFRHDSNTGTTIRITEDADGQGPSYDSNLPIISGDGGAILTNMVDPGGFPINPDNPVSPFTANFAGIWNWVLFGVAGELEERVIPITVNNDELPDAGDAKCARGTIDGTRVAFFYEADLSDPLGDGIYVKDLQTGESWHLNVFIEGCELAISGDGNIVTYASEGAVYEWNIKTGKILWLSGTPEGASANTGIRQTSRGGLLKVVGFGPSSASNNPDINADGRYIAFQSLASDLVPGDTNGWRDIFVYDRETLETTRVSVASDGTQADSFSHDPSISDDGRFVAFASAATNLVPGDTNDKNDIFVHDRQTGETIRVSTHTDGTEGDDHSYAPDISGDGRSIAFHTAASTLVDDDTNGTTDVFVSKLPALPPTGPDLIQGDNDCDGDADSVDGLKGLQHLAAINFTQEPDCPALGGVLPAALALFGDVDCDDDVDSVDALKVLRSVAALSVTQNEPCTDIGQPF